MIRFSSRERSTHSLSKTNKSLLAIPLGGLGEFGMNMMVLRYGDDIIVIDAGMMFPESELLGVDLVIPDITYLKQNREHVRAIVLTHGHEDHIGALPYILRDLECSHLRHPVHIGAGEEASGRSGAPAVGHAAGSNSRAPGRNRPV